MCTPSVPLPYWTVTWSANTYLLLWLGGLTENDNLNRHRERLCAERWPVSTNGPSREEYNNEPMLSKETLRKSKMLEQNYSLLLTRWRGKTHSHLRRSFWQGRFWCRSVSREGVSRAPCPQSRPRNSLPARTAGGRPGSRCIHLEPETAAGSCPW